MLHKITEALTFDDVLMVPAESGVRPQNISLKTQVVRGIELNIPIISAGMDSITESAMAIAMAKAGGMGIIHRNMPVGKQVEEIRKVKRHQAAVVQNPITISAEASVAEALDLMHTYKVSGLPVVDLQTSPKVIGVLTKRDVSFCPDTSMPIRGLMTSEKLVTIRGLIEMDEARKLLHENRVERLVMIDDQGRCTGLITAHDLLGADENPSACVDAHGRLKVGCAIGIGKDSYERALALAAAEVDLIVIDAPHGHTKDMVGTITSIRQTRSNKIRIVAGNVVTAAAARSLIDAGVDAVKVGVGAGSASTTRLVAGVGVPQLTALMTVVEECRRNDIPVIADGGILNSGDIAKAIAAGADAVMIGSLLAGTDEAPGTIVYSSGLPHKEFRGMGAAGSVIRGGVDNEAISESVEAHVLCKGPARMVVDKLVGGLKAAMVYTGQTDLQGMRYNVQFVRVTQAGRREGNVQGVSVMQDSSHLQS